MLPALYTFTEACTLSEMVTVSLKLSRAVGTTNQQKYTKSLGNWLGLALRYVLSGLTESSTFLPFLFCEVQSDTFNKTVIVLPMLNLRCEYSPRAVAVVVVSVFGRMKF